MKVVIEQLQDTAHRFKDHLWTQSTYLILNNHGLCGQDINDCGIFDAGEAVNKQLVTFWCTWDDDYGYGIFHSWRYSEQDGFVVVRACYMLWMSHVDISSRMRLSNMLHFSGCFGSQVMPRTIQDGSRFQSEIVRRSIFLFLGSHSMRRRRSAVG